MRQNARWVILGIVVLLAAALYWVAGIFTDWLWFSSINYQSVFLTILFSEVGLSAAIGLIFFVFIYLNLIFTRRPLLEGIDSFQRHRRTFNENVIDIHPQMQGLQWLEFINKRFLGILFFIASVILALLTSNMFSGDWVTLQKFLNGVSFGEVDPIFNKDIGFYVFKLPFYQFILSFFMWTTVVTAVIVLFLYFVAETLPNLGKIELLKSAQSRIHISALAAFFFILKGIDFYFDRYMLLFSSNGVVYGPGYTEVHATMIALLVLAVLSLVTALIILVNVFMRRFNIVFYSVVGLIAAAILLNGAYPYVIERFVVQPNQFNREEPYIAHNIKYTRQAYNLDKIEVKTFPSGTVLSNEDIKQNRETVDNIRLWDWQPFEQTYSQLQEMRTYYEFSDIDIDRYVIDGEYRQVMLAPRELNQSQLSAQAQTWVNQRLVYTHGYGVAMSPVNEVTSEGLPKFFIKDIPPKTVDDIPIDRPEIYFGEKTDNYVIVNTKTKEFDYPSGSKNVYTTYEADSGIRLKTFAHRLFFAFALSDYRLLFTGDITNESEVLMYRNIRQRVPKIAPFLNYDDDPYIVIADGKLKWMWDAYTTTNMYPYSEPFRGDLNYIRNSVKVVIDAYTGMVDFYVADPEDPLIKAYQKIFPGMFKPLEQMPEELQKHIRYPIDLFNIQAQMYTDYHMTNTQVFYNKEDRWELPTEVFGNEEVDMQAYYTIIKLPGNDKAEFVQILPFKPTNKQNMIAWMAGRSDGENYGKLLVYEFPKQELVYGPMQIEARIDQDAAISQQLTLWSSRGTSVIRGNLLVIPIEDSLLYVEPLYLKSEQSSMPELRRVIVAHGENVVMEQTLEQALQRIFGKDTGARQEPDDAAGTQEEQPDGAAPERTVADLAKEAQQLYNQAQDKLKSGDWAGYGEAQKQLQEILEQLARQAAETT